MIAPIKNGTKYENWLPTPMFAEGAGTWSVAWKWIKGGKRQKPEGTIPVVALTKDSFSPDPAPGLTVRWLGHASALVEMEGRRILIDPVFNDYASPVPGITKRFSDAPLRPKDLPPIDAVVISHDHYDHLEKSTIAAIAKTGAIFFAPSGVSSYLVKWGVRKDRIKELAWWEESQLDGLVFVCVPARHFSGRGLFARNETLWAGWVVRGRTKSIYYSGDTGYAEHFAAIGERYGPFDLTLIKIGAYNDAWPFIHLNPEQAIQAQREVQGRVLLPVHWATFVLALHPWDEPIIRALKAAKEQGVTVVTPMIGEFVDIDKPRSNRNWWEDVSSP